MASRVSFGGREMQVQEALDELQQQIEENRARGQGTTAIDQLNTTFRETLDHVAARPHFDLVSTVAPFDGEKPELIAHFFESIEGAGELSHWDDEARLRVARLKITGAALSFIRAEDQTKLTTYEDLKRVLVQRFSDKAPRHCFFQQLSIIQQRKGETIEAFADRVRVLNEKTIRVTDNALVNAAFREEADRRALDAFLRGMIGTVGEQTRLKFPTSLSEAITTAIAIEHLVKPEASTAPERKVFQTDVTCFRCHKKGHISSECRKKSYPCSWQFQQENKRESHLGKGNEASWLLRCGACQIQA